MLPLLVFPFSSGFFTRSFFPWPACPNLGEAQNRHNAKVSFVFRTSKTSFRFSPVVLSLHWKHVCLATEKWVSISHKTNAPSSEHAPTPIHAAARRWHKCLGFAPVIMNTLRRHGIHVLCNRPFSQRNRCFRRTPRARRWSTGDTTGSCVTNTQLKRCYRRRGVIWPLIYASRTTKRGRSGV